MQAGARRSLDGRLRVQSGKSGDREQREIDDPEQRAHRPADGRRHNKSDRSDKDRREENAQPNLIRPRVQNCGDDGDSAEDAQERHAVRGATPQGAPRVHGPVTLGGEQVKTFERSGGRHIRCAPKRDEEPETAADDERGHGPRFCQPASVDVTLREVDLGDTTTR